MPPFGQRIHRSRNPSGSTVAHWIMSNIQFTNIKWTISWTISKIQVIPTLMFWGSFNCRCLGGPDGQTWPRSRGWGRTGGRKPGWASFSTSKRPKMERKTQISRCIWLWDQNWQMIFGKNQLLDLSVVILFVVFVLVVVFGQKNPHCWNRSSDLFKSLQESCFLHKSGHVANLSDPSGDMLE